MPDHTISSSPSVLSTIIFDLSEVCFRGLQGTHELIEDVLGIPVTNEDMQIPEFHSLFLGKISEEAYWQALIDFHGWHIEIDRLKELVRQNMTPIPGTLDIVQRLKRKYTTVVLSVHAQAWVDYLLETYRHHRFFDFVSYSFAEGVSKPDPRAFEKVFWITGVKPEECLFIDDGPINLEAARKLGIESIHFTSADRLREQLAERHIFVDC